MLGHVYLLMPMVERLLPYNGSTRRPSSLASLWLPFLVDEPLLLEQCPVVLCLAPLALPLPDPSLESEWSSEPRPSFSAARNYSPDIW